MKRVSLYAPVETEPLSVSFQGCSVIRCSRERERGEGGSPEVVAWTVLPVEHRDKTDCYLSLLQADAGPTVAEL